MRRSLSIGLFFLMSTAQVFASPFSGDPTYGGTGCPAGSAEITLTDKGDWLVKFKEFKLGRYEKRLDRKACSIAIPIDVKPGQQISLNQGRVVGLYQASEQDTVNIQAEMFFAGSTGQPYLWKLLSDRLKAQIFNLDPQNQWTNCGESQIVRLNLSGFIRTEEPGNSQIHVPGTLIAAPKARPCQE